MGRRNAKRHISGVPGALQDKDVEILDRLPFELALPRVFGALRVREGSRNEAAVRRLVAEAQALGHPRAIYRVVFIEEKGNDYVIAGGRKFSSRVLRVNLEVANRFFAFVCTVGRELTTWAAAKEDMLEAFLADAINEVVLHEARAALDTHLVSRYQLTKTAVMNPGSLADWPLREQRPLFALLGDAPTAIGAQLMPSLLMTPAKTVSGILFPTEESFASCQLCANEMCPNRRAAYDPELYDRKYRETEA